MVEVEADVSQSLPRLVIIGLADRSLGEAEGRVRLAANNSGCRLPTGRITVNLSPAGLPKAGAGFDLAIALACLAADARLPLASVASVVHLGELSLDGRLRATPGILPAVLAARDAGYPRIMVPAANRAEAELVPDTEIIPIESLRAAAIWHGADLEPEDHDAPLMRGGLEKSTEPASAGTASALIRSPPEPSLADVLGQTDAVKALITAAAGGHHLGMVGPPGTGKSMLAARLPSLLPDLPIDVALEVASVQSLDGARFDSGIPVRPPWEAPHHSASVASIIGGGSTLIRPGAAARAAHGVLFLDEAAEFPAHVLDMLRQPLETGEIVIHRAIGAATFPGRFQLVLAANPCPCGYHGEKARRCDCPPQSVRRYRGRLSGPLLDRIDIQVRVHPITSAQLNLARDSPRYDHQALREDVRLARERAAHRLRDTPWTRTADVPGSWLREGTHRVSSAMLSPLDKAFAAGRLSMRGYDRVLRVAWTVADLGAHAAPTLDDIGEALFLRDGLTV